MTKDTPTTVSTPSDAETPSKSTRSVARFVTPALALLAAVGVGIFGGVLIGQNTAAASTAPTGFTPPDGMTQGGAAGGFTSGTITGIDGDTVTLELDDGSTVTISTTADTTVTTTDEAAVGDLAEGDTVTVIGEADDDGNVAATSISEGATGGFGGQRPATDG